MDDEQRIVNSALWAAFGDALGFMTEFATSALVRSRYGSLLLTELQPWKRRVGGRFGVVITLPAGCYSDDTQLRLATSRAIRADGGFDVEAFSRVELPVWPAYALGGGRSTKTASANLATAGVNWFTNFYETKAAAYLSAGGNGVAMRIQPHVWAARDWHDPQTYVPSVIQNGISTHGHPRALLGAVFHAVTLAEALRTGRLPEPKEFGALASRAGLETWKAFEADKQLSSLWVGVWERDSGKSFRYALRDANDDLQRDVSKAEHLTRSGSFVASYNALVKDLDAYSEANRGSAICTTVLAAGLAWLAHEDPKQAAVISANALGTDTDTIATMACALVGAITPEAPPQPPMDGAYISAEANRLAQVHRRQANGVGSFAYPDLLQWEPPRTQLDAVQVDADGDYVVVGLGPVRTKGEAFVQPPPQGGAVWQWLQLEFGQHLLIKRRQRPLRMKTSKPSVGTGRRGQLKSPSLFEAAKQQTAATPRPQKFYGGGAETSPISVEEAVRRAIESNYDPTVVGRALLALSDRSRGIELAVAFAAVVATRGQRPSSRGSGTLTSSTTARHEQTAPPRVSEEFSLKAHVADQRAFVLVKNEGAAETFKGQVVRLSNVDTLPAPLPWPIRWKDATDDVVTIPQGQEALLEVARVHPIPHEDPKKTGGADLATFQFFGSHVVHTKVAAGHADETTKPVEAVVRITTNNPRRSKSVTVLLSVSPDSQITASLQG